ncbi:hypothetical protein KP803_08655 [Vibrio sp. ZSDE26]|uniref:Uncharacterized protein n=1 Tax=Vibrio amylolyticus TaxID=2847292 RepID=A0A9X2BKY3_9VIBR|nr:hypothetical protein [Vibrio amylolyticus]MCK6263348.1 hypothetical protein [Vibrio amylolyticus]
MQSQLPPGIEKLVRVEPTQLKSEQQMSQPSKQASHLPTAHQQQQMPSLVMPLAQWQVIRMLYSAQPVTSSRHDMAYQQGQQTTPVLTLPQGRGVLMAQFELDGQTHQVRWQISQGEAVLVASTLANDQMIKLLPSVGGGWRIVTNGLELAQPVQLLWSPLGGEGYNPIASQEQRLWVKRAMWCGIGLTLVLLMIF